MPFFIRKGTKRKQQMVKKKSKDNNALKKKVNGAIYDKEIESESDDDILDDEQESFSDDEDKHLTVQEKKIKLAKKYLDTVVNEEKGRSEINGEAGEHDILKKLKENELEKVGKLKKQIADCVQFDTGHAICLHCKQHKLSITCITLSSNNQYLYSSSKDCSIVRWSLNDGSKLNFILFKSKQTVGEKSSNGHHRNTVVNCLAMSRNDKYLISGDEKGVINVWDAVSLQHIRTLQGHKNSINSFAVCTETNSLYSASKDALVKIWNLDELAYVETLFGHQNGVTSVDVLNKDRVVTSGGTDKTLRVWKIPEESQLIYNGHFGSIDLVRKLNEGFFVSCGDDGALCLWGALKKKPLYVVENSHGMCSLNAQPNWITALAVYPNSDLIASGSCNGCIRLWKWSQQNRQITSLSSIPAVGFVNALQFTTDGRYLIVAVGREHRLGRWQTIREAKNGVICVPLSIEQT